MRERFDVDRPARRDHLATMTILLIALLVAAGCRDRGGQATRATAEAGRRDAPAIDAAVIDALVIDAAPPRPEVTCSPGVRTVDRLEARGDRVVACFDGGAACWQLDPAPTPVVSSLPRAAWPSPRPATTPSTATPPAHGPTTVVAPSGWTATATLADDGTTIAALEACGPAGCSTVALVPARGEGVADHVEQVLIDDAGTAMAVTRGSSSAQRMVSELYALPGGAPMASLELRARRLSPVSSGGQCTQPMRWLGPTLLVSESDCEWPGDDFLYDRRGRKLATIPIGGDDATTVEVFELGGQRALIVVDGERAESWDVVTGRRVGRVVVPRAEDARGIDGAVGLTDGRVVLATGDGAVIVLDERLRALGRTTLPPCPAAAP